MQIVINNHNINKFDLNEALDVRRYIFQENYQTPWVYEKRGDKWIKENKRKVVNVTANGFSFV